LKSTNRNHLPLRLRAAFVMTVFALIVAAPVAAYATMQIGPAGPAGPAPGGPGPISAAAAPDLAVAKICKLDSVPPSVTCTVTVKNNGNGPSFPFKLVDVATTSAGATYTGAGGDPGLSCSPGMGPIVPISCNASVSIPAGMTNTFLFSFKVPMGGPFKNCVTTTQVISRGGPRGESNINNNTNICTTINVPTSTSANNVAIKKGITSTGPYGVNTNVTFVLNPFNAGPGSISAGGVTINDPIVAAGFSFVSAVSTPPSAWTCTSAVACTFNGPPVPAGQTFPPITLTVKPTKAGNLQNCVSIAAPGDPDMSNNKDCASVTVPMVGFPIKKAFLPGSTVTSGTFMFQVTSCPGYTGSPTVSVVAPNPGMFMLNVPAGTTCTIKEVQPAGNCNMPLYGGSSAPINLTSAGTAVLGPIKLADAATGMTVSNKCN
jgi:hypothetical protein